MPPAPTRVKSLIPAIHACRKKVVGLDDEESWRGFLERTTGKRSLRAMNGSELGKVLDALHAAGAPRKAGKGARRRKLADGEQAKMIRGLWLELYGLGAVDKADEAAIAAFVKRQAGVDALDWLAPAEANKVIEGLKAMRRRAVERLADPNPRATVRALFAQAKACPAIEIPENDVELFGYRTVCKAGFLFYGQRDFLRLRGVLETLLRNAGEKPDPAWTAAA